MMIRWILSALVLAAAVTVEAADNQAYVVDIQGEGPPVYLIPGLASPGSVWDELAADLREHGFQTRVLTLAGFAGLSPLETEPFLPQVRRQLAAELAESNSKPVLIGHSLGAFMALWLGATEPERLAGIVAIDGVPYLGALAEPDATPESNAASAEQMASFMASLTSEQYAAQNRMALNTMITDPEQVEHYAATSGLSDPATVGRAMAEMLTTDLRPLMGQVTVPVVMIQAADSGSSESIKAAYAAQLADVANLRHVVASKGRHFVQIDDPEFVRSEVLRLLERIDHE